MSNLAELIDKERLYRSGARGFEWYCRRFLFRGLDLAGKALLDVGSGNGLFSLFAWREGAARVLGLEPELDGSGAVQARTAQTLARTLGAGDAVRFLPLTFQEFAPEEGELFDTVLFHNSINHLDEASCRRLRRESAARDVYLRLLAKVRASLNSGGVLLITDSSPHSLFAHLGTRNPFASSIQWDKHQPPRLWRRLLAEVGFHSFRIDWGSPSKLRDPGRILFGNAVAAYLYTSYFRLEARA